MLNNINKEIEKIIITKDEICEIVKNVINKIIML